MTNPAFLRPWLAGLVFLLGLGFSAGAAGETGLDRCNNAGVNVAAAASRYIPATGRVELPLVFVPGSGWYRAALQAVPGADIRFSLAELVPTCDRQASPAAFFAGYATLLVPNVEVADATGKVSRFDAQLRYLPESGLFAPTQLWESDATSSPATFASLPGHFAGTVTVLRLAGATGFLGAGTELEVSRIGGGQYSGAGPCCATPHLHGTITIDGKGPYTDPDPAGCGFGAIVQIDDTTLTPGVINAQVPPATEYCGPDITAVFFARLKIMVKRLQALPDSERGVFDGTVFLYRNGANMDFATGSLKNGPESAVCPTAKCWGTGHTSTFTLCGQCLISHVDNDIEYGLVSRMLDVPWSIQLAGAHAWDVLQRGGLDPLPSQLSYRIGNDLAAAIVANSTATDQQLCATLANSRLRTGIVTWRSAADLFSQELVSFNKAGCVPCPYGCPEALIQKDFATQPWQIDGGTAPYAP